MVTDEDYECGHRHNHVSMSLYIASECDEEFQENKDYSVRLLDSKDNAEIHTVNRKVVVMNGEQFTIITRIVQLLNKPFVVKTHVPIDERCNIMEKNRYRELPNHEETLLDGVPEAVPNYMKEHQSKAGPPNLNNLLYMHMKKMVCDHTTYFLCVNVSNNIIAKNNLVFRNNVVVISLTTDRTVGIMVLEKGFKVKQLQNCCIIQHIYILSKFCRKVYRTYLMVKLFRVNKDLERVKVYAATRLIHDYTPSDYIEPESKY